MLEHGVMPPDYALDLAQCSGSEALREVLQLMYAPPNPAPTRATGRERHRTCMFADA